MAKTKKAVLAGHINRAAQDIHTRSKRAFENDPYVGVMTLGEAKAEARKYIEPITENGPMDPKFKEKWLRALHSGRFGQGEGSLKQPAPKGNRRKYVHCCLGVLSETDPKVKEVSGVVTCMFEYPLKDVLAEWEAGYHAENYRDSAMVPANFAEPRYGLSEDTLDAFAGLNDSGATFDTIGDLIEEYL